MTAHAATAAEPLEGEHSNSKLRKQYENFLSLKVEEQKESREARLYYHASHWTKTQLAELKKRKQPPTTTPVFARKINGFVGLVERMRQDPKAYPRSGAEDQGAELSTAALRYALDQQQWDSITPIVTLNSAVDAIGGIELGLEPGDSGVEGDYDVSLNEIEPETFFYDPRSYKADLSDARYMGVAKWVDMDEAIAMFPDQEEEIEALGGNQGSEFTLDNDRSIKWVNFDLKQIFLVEHWYKSREKWLYSVYCGRTQIDSGRSYLQDEKNRDICRFIAYRAFVDQDGDAYGFLRNMRSLVDEINQRNSKAMHLLASRRIKLEKGAVQDVEILRREAVRPDGVLEFNKGFTLDFEDAKTLADMRDQLQMKEAARTELENFGPNPALLGQGVENKSGRAIALLQQAGIAELGLFILSNRNWKIRVYRAVWSTLKRYWTAERWIRVTDAQGEQQAVQINAQQVDPATGMMQMVNAIGALDVDIIISEGPDQINMQADALEVLQTAAAQGQQIPPEIMIELLPLPDSLKQRLLGMLKEARQPPPGAQEAQQLQMAMLTAQLKETEASALLKQAQAAKAMSEANMPMQGGQGEQGPSQMEIFSQASETQARTHDLHASAGLKEVQAAKVVQEIGLAPRKMIEDASLKRAQLQSRAFSAKNTNGARG